MTGLRHGAFVSLRRGTVTTPERPQLEKTTTMTVPFPKGGRSVTLPAESRSACFWQRRSPLLGTLQEGRYVLHFEPELTLICPIDSTI